MQFRIISLFSTILSFFFIHTLVIEPLFEVSLSYAQGPQQPVRAPARASQSQGGSQEVDKPLKINGQSRNLNMMMTIRNESEQIGFVSPRKDFRDKVPKTRY